MDQQTDSSLDDSASLDEGMPSEPEAEAGVPEQPAAEPTVVTEPEEPEALPIPEAPAEPAPEPQIEAAAPEPAEPEPAVAVEEVLETVSADGAEPEGAEGEEAEEEEEDLARLFGDWYFVHTYSGYENKVKTNLQTRIVSMNMEEKIYEVVIPVEEVMEIKSGKKQQVERKLFPGYLLVRMEMDDDSWYVVRNTPGVTGFVGSGTRPVPLTRKEVDRILKRKPAERARPRLEWQVNDPVRVTTGPFANFQGVVSEIDVDRSKLKVLVNIFGRETPVELNFDQVAKV